MGGPAIIDGKIPIKCLDNFHTCKIIYHNMQYGYDPTLKPWISSEQLYQALKFLDKEHVHKINQLETAEEAWVYGQTKNAQTIHNLSDDNIRINLMYLANYQKILQNKDIHDILLSLKGKKIGYINSKKFWNINNGKNMEMIRDSFLKTNLK